MTTSLTASRAELLISYAVALSDIENPFYVIGKKRDQIATRQILTNKLIKQILEDEDIKLNIDAKTLEPIMKRIIIEVPTLFNNSDEKENFDFFSQLKVKSAIN
jgi:hypothetical protein